MNILGIETSCDETAAAVLQITEKNIQVLSHVVSSQVALHKPYGGVVPEVAAREHMKQCIPIIDHALSESAVSLNDIELIAATQGPGLMTSLMVGFEAGKSFAFARKIPFVGVNHLAGHVYSWLLPQTGEQAAQTVSFPFLALIISGGHTELVLVHEHGQYELLGRTVDDAVGEAFDKVAKMMHLPYPGGPEIDKAAANGETTGFDLPRPMKHSGDYQFSFAGLKTAVLYQLQELEISEKIINDMAASFAQAASDVLVTKTIRAAQEHNVRDIAVVGGVSASRFLRKEFQDLAADTTIHFPDMAYTGDNAAMIALAGYWQYTNNGADTDFLSARVDPNLRLI